MAEQKSNKKYCSLAALRYGQVLYELEIPEEDIEETKAIWESSADLREILENPVVSGEQKHGIIDRIFPEKIRSFLKVLTDHEKAGILEEVFQAYEERKQAAAGIITATLRYTALPTEEQKKEMEAFLCRTLHASGVNWALTKDMSLMGGFILSAGGKEYDYSVQGRLNRLEQKLTWR